MSNKVLEIIKDVLSDYLYENIQLADKVYFRDGKMSEEDRKIILSITNGDNYTKIISDFYYYLKSLPFIKDNKLIEEIKLLYNDVKNYNKNVFPIKDFDIYNMSNTKNLTYILEKRRKIIEYINKLPSFAKRNLKSDIRKERDYSEFEEYLSDLEYFMSHYSLLSNRDEDVRKKVLQKMFKGGNTTLDDLMRFVDDKSSFIGGVEFSKDDIKRMATEEDFDVIYEEGEIMIVEVYTPDAIKAIGCNSLWCFTYGSGLDNAYRQWSEYSYNDIVYVIIDFSKKSDSSEFMYVLIKPLIDDEGELIEYGEDESPLFDMSNENYYEVSIVLKNLFGNKYIDIIKNYLNFGY